MNAASAIAPVVFMLALGWFARKMNVISDEQNGGIKKLIFSLLLPILVFNATFTMSIDLGYMKIMGFMFALQCAVLLAGAGIFRFFKNDYTHISPYLMTTIEGGNAFYPLYIGLVGTGFSSYFVLLDIPGIFMIFLVIPLILARGGASPKQMLRNIYTNWYQSMTVGFQQIVEAMVSLHNVRERCRRVCLWAQTQSDPILRDLAFKIKCDQISRSEVAVYLTDTLQRILVLHLDSKHRREPKRLRQHHPKE